jgi:hypothetical protein
MAQIWRQREAVCNDRPILQWLDCRGVRLELTGSGSAVWIIELTQEDCERIAEAIDYRLPEMERWP